MDRISGLSDELLVKILSFVPTKVVVSTSVLSKRWETLWLSVPKLDFFMKYSEVDLPIRDFITKNLPLLKPPVIETFRLKCCFTTTIQPEDIRNWVGITVSRCIRELDIGYSPTKERPDLLLPSSLYTCKPLSSLKLRGYTIIVDVPRTVDLPCLKTLELGSVKYSNQDSLRLLLSYCPVLEDLTFDREGDNNDNAFRIVVIVIPSLLRLTLGLGGWCTSDGYVIVTPSLKYFKVHDTDVQDFSYLSTHMPKVEEAELSIDGDMTRHFKPITSVKRLSLTVLYIYRYKFIHRNGIFFNQLEHLKLRIRHYNWSKILFWLLQGAPKLRVLKILDEIDLEHEEEYTESAWWNNDDQSSIPKCLLESLETFEFEGYTRLQEERDVVSYILKNARHLKSSSISDFYDSE